MPHLPLLCNFCWQSVGTPKKPCGLKPSLSDPPSQGTEPPPAKLFSAPLNLTRANPFIFCGKVPDSSSASGQASMFVTLVSQRFAIAEYLQHFETAEYNRIFCCSLGRSIADYRRKGLQYCLGCAILNQRKTKGQQPKGKIIPALFHTFSHFSTHLHTFQSFSEFFLQDFFLELSSFTTVLGQRDEKRRKENKKKKTKIAASPRSHFDKISVFGLGTLILSSPPCQGPKGQGSLRTVWP